MNDENGARPEVKTDDQRKGRLWLVLGVPGNSGNVVLLTDEEDIVAEVLTHKMLLDQSPDWLLRMVGQLWDDIREELGIDPVHPDLAPEAEQDGRFVTLPASMAGRWRDA